MRVAFERKAGEDENQMMNHFSNALGTILLNMKRKRGYLLDNWRD